MLNLRQRAALQQQPYTSVAIDDTGSKPATSAVSPVRRACRKLMVYRTVKVLTALLLLSALCGAAVLYILYQYIPSLTNNFSTNQTVLFARNMCYSDPLCAVDHVTLSLLPYMWRYVILPMPSLREYVMRQWFGTVDNIHIGQLNSRHIFYDSVTENVIHNNNVKQVVILGSGYDTRPYRLGNDVHYFEVDQPSTIAAKRRLMTSSLHQSVVSDNTVKINSNTVTYIPADLNTDVWKADLYSNGLDRQLNTLITAEGLLYYLLPPSVERLLQSLQTVVDQNTELHFAFDAVPKCVLDDPTASCNGKYNGRGIQGMLNVVKSKGEPILYGIDEQAGLVAYNLTVRSMITSAELLHKYPLQDAASTQQSVDILEHILLPAHYYHTSKAA